MRHRFLAFHRPRRRREAPFLRGFKALFHWPVIGWHVGTIQRRVFDGRTKRGGQQCNFYIRVDDDEVPTVLQLAGQGGEDEGCWVLLESVAAEADADA